MSTPHNATAFPPEHLSVRNPRETAYDEALEHERRQKRFESAFTTAGEKFRVLVGLPEDPEEPEGTGLKADPKVEPKVEPKVAPAPAPKAKAAPKQVAEDSDGETS